MDVHDRPGPGHNEGLETSPVVVFSPVRIGKFITMSVFTFGLYEIAWFYRNWDAVKRAEASSTWPAVRAFFAPLWYYPLLKRLNIRHKAALTVAYACLVASWRLPDPYSLLAVLSFLPLLPAVQVINNLNGESRRSHRSFGWRRRSKVVLATGLVCTLLGTIGAFGPSTAVVPGDNMKPSYVEYLTDMGLLNDGEDILYFYSTGLLSIRSNGVFMSDLGITSYWIDPFSDELTMAFCGYAQILDIEIKYSSHRFEDTIVRVVTSDNSWFIFSLSPESGGDRRFLEEVEHRRATVPVTTITTWWFVPEVGWVARAPQRPQGKARRRRNGSAISGQAGLVVIKHSARGRPGFA